MDVYRPPNAPPFQPHAAERRPDERWRTRSATALRLYVASQCASAALTVIAGALFGVLRATQSPDIDGHRLVGLAFWPCVVLFTEMSPGSLAPLLVGAPRAGVLLFSLTAVSIARDVGDLGEVPRLQRVSRWQGAALACVLLAAATQGSAGASPLGLAVPALVGALACGVFLLMGVPSLLRLARVVGATRPG